MPFSLKIDVPYKATAHHRQAPANIQDFRQQGRWQHRRRFGNAAAYAASSVLIFALGIGVTSVRLNQVLTASAYDMTPTGSIAKATPGDVAKATSCDERKQLSKSDAAVRF